MKFEFKNGSSIECFGEPNDVVRAVRVEDKMVVNVNGNLYQYLDGEMDGENIDLLMGVMQVLKEIEKNTDKTIGELCDFIKENADRL